MVALFQESLVSPAATTTEDQQPAFRPYLVLWVQFTSGLNKILRYFPPSCFEFPDQRAVLSEFGKDVREYGYVWLEDEKGKAWLAFRHGIAAVQIREWVDHAA